MTFRHRGTVALAALLLSGVALHAQPGPGLGGPGEPRRPPGAGAQETERPAERPQGRAEPPARPGAAAQGSAGRDDAPQPGQREATPGERRSPAAQTQEERREERREERQRPGAAQGRTGSDRDTNETPSTPRRERSPGERGTAQPAANPQAAPQRTGQPAATPPAPAQPGQAERQPARAGGDAPDAERPNAERRAREQRGADDPARAAQPGERDRNEHVRGAAPGSSPGSAPGAAPDATPPRAAGPMAPAAPARTGQRPENGTLEPQQREVLDTVRRQVERRNLRPAANIGVTIETGATLPSGVQVHELPPDIARVRPQYRDYGFVVTEEETVIVDPRTRRVVEVIGRNPRRGDLGPGNLGPDEVVLFEDVERRSARPWRNRSVEIRRDVVLPREAPLYELPPAYIERTPRFRGHRYVVTEDEVAIVEPRSRRVVEVVRRDEMRQRSAQAQGGGALRAQNRAPEAAGSLGLTEEDKTDIARTLLRRSEPGSLASIRDLRGAVLPETLDLQRLPRSLTERTPELRDISYVLMGDDVLLVEPSTRRVVDVLR